MPRMPFIGVRISWLMLARKSPLARPAASAASTARSRARRWSANRRNCRASCVCVGRRMNRYTAAIAVSVAARMPSDGTPRPRDVFPHPPLALVHEPVRLRQEGAGLRPQPQRPGGPLGRVVGRLDPLQVGGDGVGEGPVRRVQPHAPLRVARFHADLPHNCRTRRWPASNSPASRRNSAGPVGSAGGADAPAAGAPSAAAPSACRPSNAPANAVAARSWDSIRCRPATLISSAPPSCRAAARLKAKASPTVSTATTSTPVRCRRRSDATARRSSAFGRGPPRPPACPAGVPSGFDCPARGSGEASGTGGVGGPAAVGTTAGRRRGDPTGWPGPVHAGPAPPRRPGPPRVGVPASPGGDHWPNVRLLAMPSTTPSMKNRSNSAANASPLRYCRMR